MLIVLYDKGKPYKDNQTYQNFFEYMNMMLDSECLILVYLLFDPRTMPALDILEP